MYRVWVIVVFLLPMIVTLSIAGVRALYVGAADAFWTPRTMACEKHTLPTGEVYKICER